MIAFILKLLVAASKDDDIRKFITDTIIPALVKALKEAVLPDLAALNLASGASLIKDVFNKLPGVPDIPETAGELAHGAIEQIKRDPDLPGLSQIFDASEVATKWLDRFGL